MKYMRRTLYHWRDACGDTIAAVVGLIIALGICCLFWMAVIEIESLLR